MFMTLEEKLPIVAAGRGSELDPWEGPRFHTTGGYGHQIAANVIQAANTGETLLDALEFLTDPDSLIESHRPGSVLDYIRALDDSAADELEAARFKVS